MLATRPTELSLRNTIAAKQQELQTATADLELTKTKISKHKKESDTLKAGISEERGQLKVALGLALGVALG